MLKRFSSRNGQKTGRYLYKPPHRSAEDTHIHTHTHTIDPKNYDSRTLATHDNKPRKPARLTFLIIMERLLELEAEVADLNARLVDIEKEPAWLQA